MNRLTKHIFATTLMLAVIASMAGCAKSTERVTERTVPPMERQTTTTTTPQGMQERNVSEKPMDLTHMETGQPMSYYTRHFEDMGYQIMDVDRQGDRVVYDLGKGNEMQRVTLIQEPGTDKVSSIEARKFTNVAANTQDKNVQNVMQQVEKMPLGKAPIDYIPALSKLGTVDEYRLHRDYATVNLENGKKHYKVRLDVNPDTKKVTDVTLDRNIWELPS
jgi:hypothetical protein